jgi:hypothetical protein
MIPHSKGQGVPPKVSQKVMMAIVLSGSCIAVFSAVAKWRIP